MHLFIYRQSCRIAAIRTLTCLIEAKHLVREQVSNFGRYLAFWGKIVILVSNHRFYNADQYFTCCHLGWPGSRFPGTVLSGKNRFWSIFSDMGGIRKTCILFIFIADVFPHRLLYNMINLV